jgi:hypothetical protein
MVGSQIIRSGDDDQLMRCAGSDICSPCSTEPRGLGPGFCWAAWRGGLRFAARSGSGSGSETGGSKLAGLAAWDKDVKGWVEDVGESSRLPQSLDYSFPQGVGLNRRCIVKVIRAEILDADRQ